MQVTHIMSVLLVPLILALPVVALCYADQWLHQIYVDSQYGVNDSSCWEGGYSTPCHSLNEALTGVQHHYNHSTTIILQPGQHQLHSGSETLLRNMSQLAIVGNGSQGEVVIRCEPLAGLAFSWSDEIEIANVSMIECGVIKKSTSRISTSFLVFQVAIFFINSKNIQLTNVHINRSNGTGVVVYNPVGVVNITSSLFSHNGVSGVQEAIYGGGGLVIEVNEVTSQSSCIITNSTFTHNTASSGQYSYLSPTTNPSGYFGLGRGGGISVVFMGKAVNNTVQLDGVHLVSNVAQFGGGLYLAFYDNTRDNTVSMVESEVTGNEAWLETGNQQTRTSGGGVFIGLAGDKKQCYPSDNKVNINNSTISLNSASSGGGVCVDLWQYNDNSVIAAGNKLIIENCIFNDNEAFLGSSAYFTQNSKIRQSILNTIVYSSNFTSGHCVQELTNGFGLQCNGSVLLVSSTLTLKGIVVFADNSVSALSLCSSSIQLSPSTEVQFTNNSAMNGGALHLVDCSFIVVNNGSAFSFEKNLAINRGGAIYAESCTCDSGQSAGNDCIIRHSNSTLHPNDWRMNATFTGNKALLGDGVSVYIDTIESCIWPQSNVNSPASTFCWQGWTYRNILGLEENCTHQLRSAPVFITTADRCNNYTIYPGGVVAITVSDAWGTDITSDTTVQFDVVKGSAYLSCSTVSCDSTSYVFPTCNPVLNSSTCAPPVFSVSVQPQCVNDYSNHSVLLYVYTLHQRTGIFVEIHFTQCEQNRHQPCFNQPKPLQCHSPTSAPGCIGMIMNPTMPHGLCPLSYINVPPTDPPVCVLHRKGKLCGKCANGYGVAFNHPDLVCTPCTSHIGVAYYLFVGLVPVLVMMIVLSVLHINTVNGYLSGFILYSQMVTLQFPGLGYSSWIPNVNCDGASMQYSHYQTANIPLVVYSMWNLNFLVLDPIPFCIPHVGTAVKAIALQYCIAICPLLFIAVTYLWIHCYNNGYRPVVCVTRPVHQLLARCFWQNFKIQPSLIDTYAGLIILSYMRFLVTSVKLLQFTRVYDEEKSFSHLAFYYDANLPYFGWPHFAYGVLAIVCLLVFVVPPTVVLLFYHLQCFQRCLTQCKLNRPGLHALVDVYQGCFNNSATDGSERRYFAGICLLFRVLYVSSFFTLATSPVAFMLTTMAGFFMSFVLAAMVVILRPYKKPIHNFINCLLFFYMFLISEVSVINLMPNVSNIYFDISSVLYMPFLVLCLCCTYQLCKLFIKHVQKRRNVVANRSQDDSDAVIDAEQAPLLVPVMNVAMGNCEYVADDLYADRILNPGGYNERHVHY